MGDLIEGPGTFKTKKVFDGSHFVWHKIRKSHSGLNDYVMIMRPNVPISTPEFSIRSPRTNLMVDMWAPKESKPMMFSNSVTEILVQKFGWMKQDRITYWINHLSLAPNTILVVQKEKL